MKTATRIFLALAALGPSAAAVGACILADPPPLEQIPPLVRPLIVHESVSPSLSQKITSAPGGQLSFGVPVQVDPDQSFKWKVFVDRDLNGDPLNGAPQDTGADDGGALGTTAPDGDIVGVRVVDFSLTSSQLNFGLCHTITIIVAQDFEPLAPAKPVDPPGGDSVTWFYEPVGDCSYFDAAPPTGDAGPDEAGE